MGIALDNEPGDPGFALIGMATKFNFTGFDSCDIVPEHELPSKFIAISNQNLGCSCGVTKPNP
jgi:hypothetical protein